MALEYGTKPIKTFGEKIRKGTPAITGTLKDAYLTSWHIEEEPMVHCFYRPFGREETVPYMKNTRGDAWYLHDDEYLYLIARVHDETLCSRGAEWRFAEKWPWNDDGAEFYIWFSDEDCFSVHCDAHNLRGVVDEHIYDFHKSNLTYHDVPREDWAATIDGSGQDYTVELRVRLPEYVKSGSRIGVFLEIDDRFAVGEGTENMVSALCPKDTNPQSEYYLVELE